MLLFFCQLRKLNSFSLFLLKPFYISSNTIEMFAIEATGIEKSFGEKKVLNGIDLNIQKGTIHAVLGPNGSGKTTLIKILSTLLKADGGNIRVGGHDVSLHPDKVRESISLTGQNASVDEDLTGYENLFLFARLLGYPASEAKVRANELLSAFDLNESGNKLVKSYSGGMRRRLDIAASIVKIADILFLDEPTTGLDPRSRNSLWSVFRSLSRKGTTILLSTQYLEEAEQLADKITVIDEGRVISEGTSNELKDSIGNNVLHVHLNGVEKLHLDKFLERIESPNVQTEHEGKKISFPVSGHKQAITILWEFQKNNIEITAFNLARPDLNEVFLSLTGKLKNNQNEEESQSYKETEEESADLSVSQILEHAKPYHRSGSLSNKLMFGWRNLVKVKHIPEQFMDVLITPIMFTFTFTFIFGGALAGSTGAYLKFFLPGILVQTLTFNASYSGININNDVSKGIFDRFRSMPIWLPAPLSGIFIGDFFRHLLSGCLVLIFGFILGFRSGAGIPAFVISFIIMIFFAMSISWLFIIMGLTMRSASAVMSFGWLILMPLVFLSNIFTDPSTMPRWLQTFISFNPLAWQVNAVRGLLGGTPSGKDILTALGSSLAITAILFPLTVWIYKKER
jgi:ABC-2 type transport system ATP-binding protein